jgi:hypothetical protein
MSGVPPGSNDFWLLPRSEYNGSVEHVFEWVTANRPAPIIEPRLLRGEGGARIGSSFRNPFHSALIGTEISISVKTGSSSWFSPACASGRRQRSRDDMAILLARRV